MVKHGGNLRLAAEKYRVRRDRIIDFSSNINPFGLPKRVNEIISNLSKEIIYYPDTESKELKETLSEVLNISYKNILVGNGSIELIYLITSALKPGKVLIPVPTFSEYESACKVTGAECLFLKLKEGKMFKPDLKEIVNMLSEADMLFICNPNNPTGAVLYRDELSHILKECKKNKVILVIDEAFIDFVKEIDNVTIIKDSIRNSNLLILRSMTKYFAMPGLRIGYLTGSRSLIKKISGYQYPWSVNCIAQEAAKEVVKDSEYMENSRGYIFKEREYLFKKLQKIEGIKPFKPGANFIFCRLENRKINSRKLTDLLGKKGILIRDCSNFRGLNNKYFRVAVKKRMNNRKLIDALENINNN